MELIDTTANTVCNEWPCSSILTKTIATQAKRTGKANHIETR